VEYEEFFETSFRSAFAGGPAPDLKGVCLVLYLRKPRTKAKQHKSEMTKHDELRSGASPWLKIGWIHWLKKLGYECKDVKKGIYVDGHERPDVIQCREKFLAQMEIYQR